MPSLISDNRGQKYIDVMAAAQTDDVAALTLSQTMYSILSATDDSDVEQDMGAEAVRLDLDIASSYALLGAKFDQAMRGYNSHVTKAGITGGNFASLSAYLTSRGWRMPRILADLLTAPMAPAASNVFPAETDLGAFVYGGSYAADTALVLASEGPARVVAEVTDAIGALDWVLDVRTADSGPASPLSVVLTAVGQTVTVDDASDFPATGTIQIDSEEITITSTGRSATVICTNATRGANSTTGAAHAVDAVVRNVITYEVTLSGLSAVETQVDIESADIAETVLSEQTDVVVDGETDFAAGQHVIIIDDYYPRKLTADVAAAGTVITVEDTWPFEIDDTLILYDDSTGASGDLTVNSIDRVAKTITFTGAVGGAYTTANSAHARLKTAESLERGNNEVRILDSVTYDSSADETTLVLTADLENTFYTGGTVYLLIAKIIAVTTDSGGQTADAVDLTAMPDRLIAV